jgi:hypothetical protein
MSEQPQQQPTHHDDEIDLRKLFQAIGKFFVNIGHGFINIILAIRRATFRYKYLLIAAIIFGLIIGFVFNQISKPYYQTSLLLKSDYLNTKLVDNNIAKLNLLCEEKERDGLAKVLNISNEVASNIVGFDFVPYVDEADIIEIALLKQKLEELKIDQKDIDKMIEQIEIENRNTFLITVHIYNTEIIENLQEALVGYFKNNPYVANRIKSNRVKQELLIAKLSRDVTLLDSLKGSYNLNLKLQATKPNDASNSVILGESGAVDPVSIYNQGVSLFSLLQSTKTAYELGSDFELVDGFTTFSKPESPGLLKSAVIVAGIFLALAYSLIMLIEINSYLNKIEKHGFSS